MNKNKAGRILTLYFIDCFIEAAIAVGLNKNMAKKFIIPTFIGSVSYLVASRKDPKELIKMVASKGGTTEAALKVFKRHHFDKKISDMYKKLLKVVVE